MKYYRSGIKINLSLKVVGKRPDNFHLLDSIFVPINEVYDTIGVEIKEADELKIDFHSNVNNIIGFNSQENLIVRAAQIYSQKANIAAEISIDLEKNIPIGGGVGGGSGNAACILNALNDYFGIFDSKSLQEIGLSLGADVPFFIKNKLARINGIGEIITPFEANMDLHFVLIFPNFPVSTPWAFRNLREDIKVADELRRNDLIVQGLKTADFELISNNLHNDFEEILFEKYPLYLLLQQCVKPLKLAVSGSGSSCFVLCRDCNEQQSLWEKLNNEFSAENIIIKKVTYKR